MDLSKVNQFNTSLTDSPYSPGNVNGMGKNNNIDSNNINTEKTTDDNLDMSSILISKFAQMSPVHRRVKNLTSLDRQKCLSPQFLGGKHTNLFNEILQINDQLETAAHIRRRFKNI